jgi:hypothetical protein
MSAIGLNHLLTHIIAYDSSDSHFYIVSFFCVWRWVKEPDILSCVCVNVCKGKWHFIMYMSEGVRKKMTLYHVYVWRCPKENVTLLCICAKVCKGKWHFIMYMCKGVQRKMKLYHVYVQKCAKENDNLSCICAKVCKRRWHFIMYMYKGVQRKMTLWGVYAEGMLRKMTPKSKYKFCNSKNLDTNSKK